MTMIEMKMKNVMAGPGSFISAAEALVADEEQNEVYVAYSEDDVGEHFTVSKESVYEFLLEGGEDIPELYEEYTKQKDAKTSEFWAVFALLKKTVRAMDEVV